MYSIYEDFSHIFHFDGQQKKLRQILYVLVLVAAVPLPSLAQLTIEATNRTSNSLDLKPPWTQENSKEVLFNNLDCTEQQNIEVWFEIVDESA